MDSMRHLSTSLPTASRQRTDPASDILSEFRAAALSVTNLYKTAAQSQERARTAGYQDALEDLLTFLDKENLGLMDGEGWRVRQWATERLEGDRSTTRQGTETSSIIADDEDDRTTARSDETTAKDDDKEEERTSSSPDTQKMHHLLAVSSSDLTEDDSYSQHRRVVSEPPPPPQQQQQQQQQRPFLPRQSDFTFQSSHLYPTNHERENLASMDLDMNNPSPTSSTETVRIISRAASGRNARPTRRTNTSDAVVSRPPATFNFNLAAGAGAGSKRKMPYPDFFDISGFPHQDGGERKDGSGGGGGGRGGGKRGRHI